MAKTITVTVAARMLGVSPSVVRRACRRGDLASVHFPGGHYHVLVSAVRAILAERKAIREAVRPVRRTKHARD